MALVFEAVTCGRCGGSGRYGPTVVYGGRCFGCAGRGEKLTKRGDAAQRYLHAQRTKRAAEFVPGDLILVEGFSAGSYSQPSIWYHVDRVDGSEVHGCTPDGKRISINGGVYRVGLTAEQKAALRAEALAFQALLNKDGSVARKHVEMV